MNRVEFMRQLESLLQGIAPMERDEALQYYNDYFDDAGTENEQEVIEALGNPARVAENIRRDLLGGEGAARKAKASDRALVEYGKEVQDGSSESQTAEIPSKGRADAGGASYGGAGTGGAPYGGAGDASYRGSGTGSASYGGGGAGGVPYGGGGTGGAPYDGGAVAAYPADRDGQWRGGRAGRWARFRRADMPGWAVALLVVILLFTSPVWLGLIMGAVGVLLGLAGALLAAVAGWFTMILAFGAVFVAMFVMLVVLIVTGVMCCFTNPWVGMALIGSGLVCGAIGLLFLMLTVAMAGIVTPAIFRGLGYLFRFLLGKKPAKGVN